MAYCRNCGKEVEKEAGFCGFCGSRQMISPDINRLQKNKSKHITFIFVTSLILMIIFAFGAFISFMGMLVDIDSTEISWLIDNLIITACFVTLLITMILSSKAKYAVKELNEKQKLAKSIFIASLLALISIAIYFIFIIIGMIYIKDKHPMSLTMNKQATIYITMVYVGLITTLMVKAKFYLDCLSN